MSIGKNINRLRLQHRMSQKELASIAGVSDKTVSAWETDKITPRMGPIQRMADFFGIKKSDIIESPTTTATLDTSHVTEKQNMLNEDEKKLVDNYRALTAEGKNVVWGVLNSLRITHATTFWETSI